MARSARKDRGLLSKTDSSGKVVWYVRLYHGGRERRFGSFTTKTAAREFYEKAKQEQRMGRFFPERYQHGGYDLVADVVDRHCATARVKNQWAQKRYGEWWKQRFDGRRLTAITPTSLDEAMRTLNSEEKAPQTVLHYLKFLRHILNVVVRDGKLERNPFANVTLPRVRAGRTRFLTLDDERALLTALGTTYAMWARVAILTGMRQGEQFSLMWHDLDLDHGIITLRATKAGMVQYVYLNEEAKGILRDMQALAEAEAIAQPTKRSEWVFPSENPASHIDPRNFYIRVYLPAVEQANLDGVTWHTLRHTFASRLAMTGKTEGTIAALLRHSTTRLVARYAHLSPSHLKTAVEERPILAKTDPRSLSRKRYRSPQFQMEP